MAETATDSAPNGRKLDEHAKVEEKEPVNEGVVAAAAAPGTTTADKAAPGDLKSSFPTKVVKVVVDTADSPAKGEKSTIKVVTDTKASSVEVVAKETSDHKKGDAEPMEEDVKATTTTPEVVANTTENKNAGLSQQPDHSKEKTTTTTVSTDTKSKSKSKASLETKPVLETKAVEEEKITDVKANNSTDEQKDDAIVEEEGKVEAMDIDDKKQEKVEVKVEPKKVGKQAGVVVNPKKKLGRPKKIRDPEAMKEEEEKQQQKTPAPETTTKKRPRQKKEPVTPLSDSRPARERKSIERFVASTEKGKKELVIKKGTGTALMDIPNVSFKLAKRAKGDEILNMLHSLLYNKRAKANVIKYNIFRFSGYVWNENEEKERSKVREKLERYTKEGLGQLIDVLDLHFNKTGKKEELVAKVLEFLESPHKTTDVSLEEREQKMKEKKRKSRTPGTPGRGRGPGRKRRKLEESSSTKKRGRRKKNESDDDTQGDYADSGDESLEEEEEVERKRLTFMDEHDEEDDDDDEDYEAKQKPQKRPAKPSKEEVKEPVEEKVSNNEEESESDLATKRPAAKSVPSISVKSPKASSPDITRSSSKPAEKVYTKGSRKKSKELKEKEKEAPPAKRVGKQTSINKEKIPKEKIPGKTGRGRRGKKRKVIPSDEVLQNEIRDLLKDLSQEDFSRVTYMDIVIQLEEKFNVDLSVKKGHVKLLIRQELSRLAEEVDEEDDDQEAAEAEGPAEVGAEAEVEPEEAAEGEATDTTDTAGKAETPEAEPVVEADAAGDSDVGETAKDVEASKEVEAEVEVEAPTVPVPVKAESTKGKTVDDQPPRKAVAEVVAAGD